MEPNILKALICILGALVALWIAYFQIKEELRRIREHGIHKAIGLMVSEDDIRHLADLVIDEIKHKEGHES